MTPRTIGIDGSGFSDSFAKNLPQVVFELVHCAA